MKSSLIKKHFLEFFNQQKHKTISSTSLLAKGDETLMFTNAGMVPFKNIFTGAESAPADCAVSIQRCMRAGGKHNDLENVGYTYRHHTFFEMMGNFSFGAYFKKQAIEHAWKFLTHVLKISKDKLWVTIYEDDQEAKEIWIQHIGVNPSRISACSKKDNFWSMGATGPCGPCSEIFYDHGPHLKGHPPQDNQDTGDRYVEIWNLVFMQYDLQKDGTLVPLQKPCVDTGMGLERISAVMQGVFDNYQTDLFKPLIASIQNSSPTPCTPDNQSAFNAIADHIRAIAFLINDEIFPTNEGPGYVLRRIIRRAVRHGYLLGFKKPFLHHIMAQNMPHLSEIEPSITPHSQKILDTLKHEESLFFNTLVKGLNLLDVLMAENKTHIDGDTAFKLYDTYGFPIDLSQSIAEQKQCTIDLAGFTKRLAAQKNNSKNQHTFFQKNTLNLNTPTAFIGYQKHQCKAIITQLFIDEKQLSAINAPAEAAIVLDQTVFYPQSGGQAHDTGTITTNQGTFEVTQTAKHPSGAIVHVGILKTGTLRNQDTVTAAIDLPRRQAITRGHSATHLLHAALRNLLGPHVQQRGSHIESSHLRFDFSHHQAVDAVQLSKIEQWVNDRIYASQPVQAQHMSLEQAKEKGAMAFFDEKYDPKNVRVLEIGEGDSVELCGGTHVASSIEIGLFKITSESALSSGIRRIEAKTGAAALAYLNHKMDQMHQAASKLSSNPNNLLSAIDKMLQAHQKDKQALLALKQQKITSISKKLEAQIIPAKLQNRQDILLLEQHFKGLDLEALQLISDPYQKNDNILILLSANCDSKHPLFIVIGKALQHTLSAKKLLEIGTQKHAIKGGGNHFKAQGFANNSENLAAFIQHIKKHLQLL